MGQQKFNNIILIGRANIEGVPAALQTIKQYLLDLGTNVLLEESTADIIPDNDCDVIHTTQPPKEADLIIVVGGDGSLLHATQMAVPHDLPVLGIHRGRLGFLTDIAPDDIEQIGKVIEGHYQEEHRTLLQAELKESNETLIGLNEIALLPGDVAQMIKFNVHVDQQFVCKQRADGLIVATPTGSTAYALSAGGPILHPDLQANVLVPMFSHTLSSRPIVVSRTASIELHVCESNISSPYISNDGIQRIAITPGNRVTIKRHHKTLRLIHPESYNYYATLREKLGWERHAERP